MSKIKFDQEAINLMPGNVYFKGTDGRYQGCNIRMARVLGLDSPADIIGKTTLELLGPGQEAAAAAVDEVDNHVMKTREPFFGTEKDGEYLSVKEVVCEMGFVKGMVGFSAPLKKGFVLSKKAEVKPS